MATKPTTPLVFDPADHYGRTGGPTAIQRHAALGAWAASGMFMVGSIIDVGVLWLLQRQDQPQWEFVAIANTLDAFPRFALAIALLYAALYFGRSSSIAVYRVAAVGLVFLGLAAAALGALMVTDYFALAKLAGQQPQALEMIRTTSIRAVILSGVYVILLVPLGIIGLRRPKSE